MLGSNWQIYSYAPTVNFVADKPHPALTTGEKAASSGLPPFLQKALKRVADKYNSAFDKERSTIDSKIFYLDVGYCEDDRVVRVYGFGVKDREAHDTGIGKEVLQYFFSSLAIYTTKSVDVTLWSVSTAIGFYLRCGMAIQAVSDTFVDPVETYYKRKAELFGDEWDKYAVSVVNQLGTDELKYDDVFPIFEASDFYQEEDPPGVFSMWIEDVVGYRSHHMIYHIEPKRSAANTLRV